MGRKPDPARRAQLLADAGAYALAHGLAGLSLRPLAGALGVSPRTLLYHFGSKEQLLTEIVLALQAQVEPPDAVAEAAATGTPAALRASVLRLWDAESGPETRPFLCLFLETFATASRDPEAWRPFLDAAVGRWQRMLEPALLRHGGTPAAARAQAREAIAVFYGLALVLLATGDAAATRAVLAGALERLLPDPPA